MATLGRATGILLIHRLAWMISKCGTFLLPEPTYGPFCTLLSIKHRAFSLVSVSRARLDDYNRQ